MTPEEIQNWLEEIQKDADENSVQLGESLNCKVSNYIFPLKDGEDCAIAYVKQPDALQAFKIMRSALETTIEAGRILVIKSQLIRELEGKQISDKRFMDVEGKYLPEDSNLNLGLMLAVNDLIEPTRQYFKKK